MHPARSRAAPTTSPSRCKRSCTEPEGTTGSRWRRRGCAMVCARGARSRSGPPVPGHLGGQVQFVLSSLLNGVAYGLLLFMLSSGLTLIFSMMSILNFAHAAFYMLGAYFAYQISAAVGFWPGLVIAPLLVGITRPGAI